LQRSDASNELKAEKTLKSGFSFAAFLVTFLLALLMTTLFVVTFTTLLVVFSRGFVLFFTSLLNAHYNIDEDFIL
jgi:hypothetical protein